MAKNTQFILSFENTKNIPFEKYDNNFTFIVDRQRYVTSRVKAYFLSPIVSRYHDTDESIQEITITTSEQKDEDYFSDFLNLTNFEENAIDEKRRTRYIEYFYLLGNTNECYRLQSEYFENLSTKNIVDRL